VVLTLLPGKGTVFVVMGPPSSSSGNSTTTPSTDTGGTSGANGSLWSPHLTLMKVTERDIATKLDVLFKMNFYAHGILMAKVRTLSCFSFFFWEV
jgi:hypothetical protein